MLLAVLVDAELSQEHASNLARLYRSNKGVGFHYKHFSITPRCVERTSQRTAHRKHSKCVVQWRTSVSRSRFAC